MNTNQRFHLYQLDQPVVRAGICSLGSMPKILLVLFSIGAVFLGVLVDRPARAYQLGQSAAYSTHDTLPFSLENSVLYQQLGNDNPGNNNSGQQLAQGMPNQQAERLLDDAEAAIRRRDFQTALEKQTQAIQLVPDLWSAYFSRAMTRRWVKDYEGAIADFTHLIQLYPEEASSYANRGLVYVDMGNREAAIADLQQAKTLWQEQKNVKGVQTVDSLLQQLTNRQHRNPSR